jgi:hypothetical protein
MTDALLIKILTDEPGDAQVPFGSVIPEGGSGVAIYWSAPVVTDDPLGRFEAQYLRWDAPCFKGVDWRDTRTVAMKAYAATASMHPIPTEATILCEIRL